MKEMIGNQKNKNRDKLDFYATHPSALIELMKRENIYGYNILENSAGNGHLSKELMKGNNVISIDIVEREFKLDFVKDFLDIKDWKEISNNKFDYVIYNPPFKYFIEFVKHSFNFADVQWVFGRIQILESKKRYNEIFKNGWLEKVYIFSNRMSCAKGGDENSFFKHNSMVFAWFKFNKNFKGKPTIDWVVFE